MLIWSGGAISFAIVPDGDPGYFFERFAEAGEAVESGTGRDLGHGRFAFPERPLPIPALQPDDRTRSSERSQQEFRVRKSAS